MKTIKMPSWMTWVQRTSGIIKMGRSTRAFKANNVTTGANIGDHSKSLSNRSLNNFPCCFYIIKY
jgi:hypothetical protein